MSEAKDGAATRALREIHELEKRHVNVVVKVTELASVSAEGFKRLRGRVEELERVQLWSHAILAVLVITRVVEFVAGLSG